MTASERIFAFYVSPNIVIRPKSCYKTEETTRNPIQNWVSKETRKETYKWWLRRRLFLDFPIEDLNKKSISMYEQVQIYFETVSWHWRTEEELIEVSVRKWVLSWATIEILHEMFSKWDKRQKMSGMDSRWDLNENELIQTRDLFRWDSREDHWSWSKTTINEMMTMSIFKD